MKTKARDTVVINMSLINPFSFLLSSYLNPKDAIAPSSASATCEAQYEYLFCIPGTYTYLFFGTRKPLLQPATSYAQALISSIEFVNQHIEFSGDGPIADGDEYFTTSGTNVQVYVEDANNHQLTWGVAGVALQGLNTWMAVEDNGYSDATFQINDGRNWVGNGYIGALNLLGICVFANAYVPNTTCSATDANGFVYGSVYGGKLC